jgi:uncharacterized protein with HEPN domain
MRDDREGLRDIVDAILSIERYPRDKEDSELIESWVLRHLQIIGEAASKLSTALRTAHPDVPWVEMIAMRNILVYDYFGIDTNEVWAVVEKDLPKLKQKIEAILQAELGA